MSLTVYVLEVRPVADDIIIAGTKMKQLVATVQDVKVNSLKIGRRTMD